MIAESDLRELLNFSAAEPVLSLYLNADPTIGNADFYRLRLCNMLKEVSLSEDVSAVERFFNGEYDWPGRGGMAGMTRHEDEVVERNLKDCVVFATHFFEENHVRRILIGGSDDSVAQFRSLLPKAWQSLVVGSFPMSMASSQTDVMAKAMQCGMEAELHREARQVEIVVTAAAKGSGGVVGLEHTLNAIRDGRVQVLLVSEGYRQSGFRCKGCGAMTVVGLEKCAFCGEALEKIADGVELAVRAVMQAGGEVNIVHANPVLERAGKIGAILRY